MSGKIQGLKNDKTPDVNATMPLIFIIKASPLNTIEPIISVFL